MPTGFGMKVLSRAKSMVRLTEGRLDKAVQIPDSVGQPANGREDLPRLGGLGGIAPIEVPVLTVLGRPERLLEARDVVTRRDGLELLDENVEQHVAELLACRPLDEADTL